MKDELFRERLRSLMTEYHLTLKSISKLTDLSLIWLKELLDGKGRLDELTDDQLLNLSLSLEMLRVGITGVSDDERVITIMKLLMQECGFSVETIATYAFVEVEQVRLFLLAPEEVNNQVKYQIATKVMFIFSLYKDCITLT